MHRIMQFMRRVAGFEAVDTVTSHDSRITATRRDVGNPKSTRKATPDGGRDQNRNPTRSGRRGARVRATSDAGSGGNSSTDEGRAHPDPRRDSVRDAEANLNDPVFLASAVLQRTRMANLSATNTEAGNQAAATVFETCAQMTELVENEIRQGVRGRIVMERFTS
jgi:hypothetical protein